MQTLCTAGHIDHGKSALVRALTGIDPDRLREEKERGLTIDLGFAWLTLPSGRTVNVIDVPGHEDLIRNMLAGVSAVDAVLLVVAADDGVMPQTREHLAIMGLAGVSSGVVALNKIDVMDDQEWIDLVEADVKEALAGTHLASAEVVPVSARSGKGLERLRATLDETLARVKAREDLAHPRLPIDRVFSISGFGTVVTGTLVDGSIYLGQELMVFPDKGTVRVRGLQVHGNPVDRAEPGTRVAVNLHGGTSTLHRGTVLAEADALEPAYVVHARVRMLGDLSHALRHNEVVECYWGTARTMARARLIEGDELEPGKEGWVEFRFAQPVSMLRNDRFIIRHPSLGVTLGGGRVADPRAARHSGRRKRVLASVERLNDGGPRSVVKAVLSDLEPCPAATVIRESALPRKVADLALQQLLDSGEVLSLATIGGKQQEPQPAALLVSPTGWARITERLRDALHAYHLEKPLRRGMPREQLRHRMRMDPPTFNAVLGAAAREGLAVSLGPVVSLTEHDVRFTPEQEQRIDGLKRRLRETRNAPPSRAEMEAAVGPDVFEALVEQRFLIKVADDLYYPSDVYDRIVNELVQFIRENGRISVAQVRDLFGISRKYVIPLLQHCDDLHLTRRIGDDRVLFGCAPEPGERAPGREGMHQEVITP
ncbi:selenocysteine-specific translation elongation factor [Limnochorda pilosa]|uniref:Selenocysteine-specific elongation factor n=1 Tax=Limnochorda pilosa TaxID=1555112 RepID=A0A0K2SGJ9_LIMPI|nr:selenocysteine-specific translation elongation factor [Limnochorda pilosa]BAS26215.1 translation elongation factor [Limnochorda pilosa]